MADQANDFDTTPHATPRPTPRPRPAQSQSDEEQLAEEFASGVTTVARVGAKGGLAQTLLASAFTALVSGGVVGFGGSQAAAKLEAKVDVLGAKLDAITSAAGRAEATAAAQQHEDRIRKLEAAVADHETRLRISAGK